MGPNMYITPGGGFTQLHQDGHGTVDSGHIALQGYNEVVMLRRLPERHKVEACRCLPSTENNGSKEKRGEYDGLYGLPHDQTDGHGWPTKDTIAHWNRMNYCPSVFILKEGQHIHINKGRLHAFRKLTPETLPTTDCHFELRDALIKENGLSRKAPPKCVSIAWDWQFSGVHAEGIHRETMSILESAFMVDKQKECKCLAIPKASILAMARQIQQKATEEPPNNKAASLFGASAMVSQGGGCAAAGFEIDNTNLARGILPALRFLVDACSQVMQSVNSSRVMESVDAPVGFKSKKKIYRGRVSIAPLCDCDENGPVDPDGPDYYCDICSSELFNEYFHCDGCEMHLNKDFNICVDCHRGEKWKATIKMCPSDGERKSTINHTGDMPFERTKRCVCKKGKPCTECGFCSGKCVLSLDVRVLGYEYFFVYKCCLFLFVS